MPRILRLLFLSNMPLAWRLPIAIAVAMFLVAFATTQIGLATLEQREERALVQKAEIFLDTLAGLMHPATGKGEEAIRLVLSEAATFKPSLRDEAVAFCCLAGERVVMAEQALGTESGALLRNHTQSTKNLAHGDSAVAIEEERQKLLVARAFESETERFVLAGVFDIQLLLGERRANRQLALLIDMILAFACAALAFVVTRCSLRPIDRLTEELTSVGNGAGAVPLPKPAPNTEIGRLESAIKRRLEEEDYRSKLIAEASEKERHTVLAQLAAGLAHEVRNPLAGLLGAISTLRRFGADEKVRTDTLDLMERGLNSIERVAATMLSTYRPHAKGRDLLPADIDDLSLLIQPELKRKSLFFEGENGLTESFPTDADGVRQLLLNLLLNACNAAPAGGTVRLAIQLVKGGLQFQVSDNGPGLSDDVLAVIADEAGAPVPKNKRLGLWLVARIIDDLQGQVAVESREGRGTTVKVTLKPLRHHTGDHVGEA